MNFIALQSTDLPPGQRFDWWCDLISHDVAPTRITSDHTDDFRATAGAVDLNDLRITTMSFPALRSERTPALIRRSDPEMYELTLITGGEMWISQAGKDARIHAGDLVMWDTSRPYDGRGLEGTSRAMILHLPRAQLPLPVKKVDELLARRMPARAGMAAILAHYLRSLVRQTSSMALLDVRRLGTLTLDLAMAFLAHRLNAQDRLPLETRQQALRVRIRAFVEHNLADPHLSPAAIAAHHHISVRYLHLLFQRPETTVMAWIRQRRLENCRADLADPRLRAHSIQDIAARWGFTHATDFSRSFRRAYGMSPKDYRHSVLDSP
ncbi:MULTISPECIES: helix-turn-helix domain-containing protein [Streptosporangium]|uniref:AraC-like DNA-binding protein n=1 Tax=Streptosporangium brasiliense TaxID=47480 RepID=A0ABT9QWX1_9ACTN|nr:helix-turn-helix domain-containing protein [Streptosporangium brasiliense]MDP9861474.1 AraC-like DNA-binding protein [Streptosporangium brasiliense]